MCRYINLHKVPLVDIATACDNAAASVHLGRRMDGWMVAASLIQIHYALPSDQIDLPESRQFICTYNVGFLIENRQISCKTVQASNGHQDLALYCRIDHKLISGKPCFERVIENYEPEPQATRGSVVLNTVY